MRRSTELRLLIQLVFPGSYLVEARCPTFQACSNEDKVYVWAVSSSGDALYRHGVSHRCPEGTDWIQVNLEICFIVGFDIDVAFGLG